MARRGRYVLLWDIIVLVLAVYLGYALRLTLFLPRFYLGDFVLAALLFPGCVTGVFAAAGLYRVLWPQASVEEFLRLARWYALGALLFVLADKFFTRLLIPRTTLAIMIGSGILFLGAVRLSWRLCRSGGGDAAKSRARGLIVGAGEAGTLLVRDLLRGGGDVLPLGFVDDDPAKTNMEIAGVRVLGNTARLRELVETLQVEVLLIALPTVAGHVVRKILDDVAETGVQVRVLPSLRELAGGTVSVSRLRTVRLEDLLCREAIRLDLEGIDGILRGRSVLVTGAGGSIGSEICRQVLAHGPRELVLLGHGEHSIYTLLEELGKLSPAPPLRAVIGDVADARTMEGLFRETRPGVVFHAAAHKHVPLMEFNAREALRVNALGTWTVARLAGEYGAERLVLISTDKAVNPTSVMGATKRLAEMLLQEAQSAYPGTAYLAVRFGNVLGSRGSVVPKFERQIRDGGPLTVTHPEMRRYFMLIPEAVSLVLQAASIGEGGELFVLDMGEPVRIAALAEMLIRLHGYRPNGDIPIVYTGLRPGEKLFEELFYDPDHVLRTTHEKIFAARLEARSGERLAEALASALAGGDEEARALLRAWVPTYAPGGGMPAEECSA